jgi:predicted exporter
VAIDYPLHLFTHAQHQTARGGALSAKTVWPTLRLGIFSTLIAYAAFISTGTMGLQQLGVFATFGIATAALASAWLSAEQSKSGIEGAPASSTKVAQQRLRYAPGLVVILIAAGTLTQLEVFNDDLGSLTPVDPELLTADAAIRRQLGVTDIRHIVAVRGPTLQECLQETEDTVEQLSQLMNQGMLGGIQAITQILPSEATQQARRALLRQPDSQVKFNEALALSAFQGDAFRPFLEAWHLEARNKNNLTIDTLRAEPALAGIVDSLLYQDSKGWVSLLFLQRIVDLDVVAEALSKTPNTQIVDLKETSTAMVSEYRSKLLIVLVVALLAISGLLIAALNTKKLMWLLSTVGAAVTLAAAISAIWQGGLSLFDLMALTLVAGLGLDYALFYSSDRYPDDDPAIDSAVLICALSSLLVFGVLSFSSIPVLSGIGTTVSIGVLAAYLLARFGRYANSGN